MNHPEHTWDYAAVIYQPFQWWCVLWHHQCTGCSQWDTFAGRCGGDPKRLGQLYISEENGTVSTVHYDARKVYLTCNSGSICWIISRETGISPDGSVSFVLSTYIGLHDNISIANHTNLTRGSIITLILHTLLSLGLCSIIMQSCILLYSIVPVSRENEPRCPCPVYSLKMVVEEGPLPRSIAVVMLSAHHHHMNRAKVKSIPVTVISWLSYRMQSCVTLTKVGLVQA